MSDARLRVVLWVDAFPAISETFFVQRLLGLLDRGWDVRVFCAERRDGDWRFFPERAGRDLRGRVSVRPRARPKVVSFAVLPYLVLKALLGSPRLTARYLTRGWKRFGPRVIARLYYDAPLIALRPDAIHFAFGWFAVGREYLGDLLGAKLLVSFQGADINYGGLEAEPGYYDTVWQTASTVHFQGEDLRRRAMTRGYRDDGRDMVVLPGIDTASFAPDERPRAAGEPLRVLSVGRLHWKKGYEHALHAIRLLLDLGVDCRFRIVGDGPFREALLYARHDLGLVDVVEFLGPRSGSGVRAEMQWADVFLHAATSEGFCYAVAEAQAMKLPVVTSDADGLRENVDDGVSGFVVPRRDASGLAEGLAKLARDPSLRTRMGEAGRERVTRLFDPKNEILGFESLYLTASGERPRR